MNTIPRIAMAVLVLAVALFVVLAIGRAYDNVNQQLCGPGSRTCSQPLVAS